MKYLYVFLGYTVLLLQLLNGAQIQTPGSLKSSDVPIKELIDSWEAPEGFAPYMVALMCGGVNYAYTHFSAGSIISSRHILTAAHSLEVCVRRSVELLNSFHGRVGSNQWYFGGILIKFKDYRIHPQWNPQKFNYDVAMLFLTAPLSFNERVSPIALDFNFFASGKEVYVTGWGATETIIANNEVLYGPVVDNLQLLYEKTITPVECIKGIEYANNKWGEANNVYPDLQLCTFQSAGHGMCKGDSGGPLVSVESRKQVGIVSWGFSCAIGIPDVHTRISAMKPFITEMMNYN